MNKERAIELIREAVASSHPHLAEGIQQFGAGLALGINLDNFDTTKLEQELSKRIEGVFVMSYCDSIEDIYYNHEPLFREHTE